MFERISRRAHLDLESQTPQAAESRPPASVRRRQGSWLTREAWWNIGYCAIIGLILAGSISLVKLTALPGDNMVTVWLFNPIASWALVCGPPASRQYLVLVMCIVYVVMCSQGFGKIKLQTPAHSCVLLIPDLIEIFGNAAFLIPQLRKEISIVRSSEFLRVLLIWQLSCAALSSIFNTFLLLMVYPRKADIMWKILVFWGIGQFFSNFIVIYSMLVFRDAVRHVTQGTYSIRKLLSFLWQRFRNSGYFRIIEYCILIFLVSLTGLPSRNGVFLIIRRLLFPLVGLITIRFGQVGSCMAIIVAAISIMVGFSMQVDHYQLLEGKTTDLMDILLAPLLVVLLSWSVSFLAVVLAERQDAFSLLKERNSQLLGQERELTVAKKAVEDAIKMKTDFFAQISHRFRIPLHVIIGSANELRQGQYPDYIVQRIKYIQTSGESLLRIADDILELFQITSAQLEINPTITCIHDYFRTVCSLIDLISKENSQTLRWTLDPSVPKYIFVDQVRFCQLVLNLGSNASKYTQAGGNICLALKTVPSPPDAPHEENQVLLRLEVSDNGVGIPENVRHKIFDCFYRDLSNTAVKGHGLGLAITKQLIGLMRGTIEVESEVGKGSAFILTFPVPLGDESLMEEESPEKVVTGLRILTLNDTLSNQAILQSILQKDHHLVTFTNTPADFRKSLDDFGKELDIILLVFALPDSSGKELLREIHEHSDPVVRSLPVILVSAKSRLKNNQSQGSFPYPPSPSFPMKSSKQEDEALYVAKPLRQLELRQAIADIAQRKGMAQALS